MRSDAAPVTITGERQGLINLIDNLIENAIKYAPAGSSVLVRVATEPAGSARLTVEDSGPGIPAGLRERVFVRFIARRIKTSPAAGSVWQSCDQWPRFTMRVCRSERPMITLACGSRSILRRLLHTADDAVLASRGLRHPKAARFQFTGHRGLGE